MAHYRGRLAAPERAYLLTYRSNDLDTGPPIAVFDYQPGRSGRYVQDFLRGWQGHLVVDDYAGYKALFQGGVTELACLAHARRKFFEIHAAKPLPLAQAALARIAELTVSDNSGIARALDYSLKLWPAIRRYAEDGTRPIDNNPVENTILPIAIGCKNWLFAGSGRTGQRAAAIQSLLATAKLNGIEPYAWLKETIEKLSVWPYSRIDELLPLRVSG